eukprot:SM005482S18186  [mRNA]  locus=s5482:3:968:- [translate_table: standard]
MKAGGGGGSGGSGDGDKGAAASGAGAVHKRGNAAPLPARRLKSVPSEGSLTTAVAPASQSEREDRRLRRVQANRESARQTIRRKQVLCEQLSQRAATLAKANDGLRLEVDGAKARWAELFERQLQLKRELEHYEHMESGKVAPAAAGPPSAGVPPSNAAAMYAAGFGPSTAFPSSQALWAIAAHAAAAATQQQAQGGGGAFFPSQPLSRASSLPPFSSPP